MFSNPISGIACEVDSYNRDHRMKICTQNIRYSKSMILRALDFWFDQLHAYYMKVRKIRSSFMDISTHILPRLKEHGRIMNMIEQDIPDTFLFSHRYIQLKSTKYSKSMNEQLELLNKKYPFLKQECREYGYDNESQQVCYKINIISGIGFTVFPNEHPYIHRQKISKVGMTEKGNVFVIHSGAQKK